MSGPISAIARQKVRDHFARDMIDTVVIQRGDPGTFNETSGVTTGMTNPVTVYSGNARLPKASPDGELSVGDGEISQREMSCQIPWDSEQVYINDIVTISAAQDAQLVGTTWRVIGVDGGGSWMAFRSLTMTTWYPSSQWSGS